MPKFTNFQITMSEGKFTTALFMGAGFCYIFERKKYIELPLLGFPVAYGSYHLFKNRKNLWNSIENLNKNSH